ncbi:MAG: NADP-dependent phosphogluconate dehydrogenase [Chitinophagaceae bacterium]|nr:MAG: NADP-dependent phosphogluconate dehydrogenase [Chitinophagaceae bacterium]
MSNPLFDFGMIGLGVMGRNFLLNMADHGFSVVGLDKDNQKALSLEKEATKGTIVKGVTNAGDFINALKKPRSIMMLVPAGKPVDAVIEEFLPLLDKGDILIDGGNSHYTDTVKRIRYLEEKGIHFMGMGVSGGEKGARFGPSIMPGGDQDAWRTVQPMLEAVSAKVNGSPCVAYLGKDAAGHYVKMVHNGIEYAIMQLISETYMLMHRGLGLNNDQLHGVFKKWNEGNLQSYLIEITRDIFMQQDDKTNNRLVDMILDEAGAKGTGMWTSQDAMSLHYPIPLIDIAVSMRDLSVYKEERTRAEGIYGNPYQNLPVDKEAFIAQLHDALYFAVINCYAQGLGMIQKGSAALGMDIPLSEVVRIWRGGCIIRSVLLDKFFVIYSKTKDMPNILLSEFVSKELQGNVRQIRAVIVASINAGYPVPGLSASLNYFDSYRRKHLPVNLLQAQRDYFGSHTYQRIDEPGIFHTEWKENNE